MRYNFIALLAVEDWRTPDRRLIKGGALTVKRDAVIVTSDKDPAGVIESIYRVGRLVYGTGWIELPMYTIGEVLQIDVMFGEHDVLDQGDLVVTSGEIIGARLGTKPAFPQACIVLLEEK